jgi:HEAT repeat protein
VVDLSIRLVVFIASPGDLDPERAVVHDEVTAASNVASRHGVQIEPFQWEDGVTPGYSPRVQERLSRVARTAELTIVMFWHRLGSAASFESSETGTMEELRVAGEQVARGWADDVFVYFKQAPPPIGASPGDVQAVREFRAKLHAGKQLLTADFQDVTDFRTRLRRDLQLWSERWYRLRDVCRYLLSGGAQVPPEILGEARLTRVLPVWKASRLAHLEPELATAAVALYQGFGPEGWTRPLPNDIATLVSTSLSGRESTRSPGSDGQEPVLRRNGASHFAAEEWFHFFCAMGLITAITNDDVEAVSTHPYVNEVHQFLAAVSARRKLRPTLSKTLRRWLLDTDGITAARPVARNFAAYVLGMIECTEAQDDLVQAMESDRGEDVRLYCITSLGKLRARRYLPELIQAFEEARDSRVRNLVAESICRMTGLANFEL